MHINLVTTLIVIIIVESNKKIDYENRESFRRKPLSESFLNYIRGNEEDEEDEEEEDEEEEFEKQNDLNIEESINEYVENYSQVFQQNEKELKELVIHIYYEKEQNKNNYLKWYEHNDLVKDLKNNPLEHLLNLLWGIKNMSKSDYNQYFYNKTKDSYFIRNFSKISPFEIENLARIYNLNIIDPNRRKAKILRKYSKLSNIIIIIGYLVLKESKFKKGYIKYIAKILHKIIEIPVDSLRIKISQVKYYVETSNTKQISKGLIYTYRKFNNISLNKLLKILMEYQYFTDENIEKRFNQLLIDSSYLDGIENDNYKEFHIILRTLDHYSESLYNETFLAGTYHVK